MNCADSYPGGSYLHVLRRPLHHKKRAAASIIQRCRSCYGRYSALTASLNFLPALKLGTFREGIIIRSPVKRLRPSLAGRIFSPNVPKPGRMTFSPLFKASVRDFKSADSAARVCFQCKFHTLGFVLAAHLRVTTVIGLFHRSVRFALASFTRSFLF